MLCMCIQIFQYIIIHNCDDNNMRTHTHTYVKAPFLFISPCNSSKQKKTHTMDFHTATHIEIKQRGKY